MHPHALSCSEELCGVMADLSFLVKLLETSVLVPIGISIFYPV